MSRLASDKDLFLFVSKPKKFRNQKTLARNTSAAVHRDFRQSRMSPRILAINVLCKSAIDVARGRRIALTSLVQRVIRDGTDRQTGDKLAEDWTLVWVTRSRWRASSDLPLYCHDSWSGLHSYFIDQTSSLPD